MCVLTHAHARGVWGYAPLGKFCKLDAASEATFWPKPALQLSLLSVRLRMYDRIDVHMPCSGCC